MGDEIKHSWMCRVCLEPRKIGNRSILEKIKEYCIMDYINKLTSVNIKITDGLPDKICSNCFLDLEVALSFIERCKKTDKFLKTQYKSLIRLDGADIKVELDVPEIKSEETINNYMCHADERDAFQYLDLNEENDEGKLVKQEIPKSQVECHDCGNVFKSKCKLRVHWKQTHMLDALICPHCKRRFKTYKTMHQHLKNKSKACSTACDPNVIIDGEGKLRIFYCKECGHKSRRIKDIEAHLRTHNGEKPFLCDLCHKGFSQLSALQSHNEGAHKKYLTQVTCQYCGKIVKGRKNVYRHLLRHREGPHPCPVCEKLVTRHHLRQHMLRHTGVKTYTCEFCAAAFYTNAELSNHRRYVHIKSVMYKCELCDYKSIRKEVIKKHQSKHTDTNISCDVCGKFSTTVDKAMVHRRLHFNDKPHECPQCHRGFVKRNSIRKHMLMKHCSMVDHNIAVKCESAKNKVEPLVIEIPKASPS